MPTPTPPTPQPASRAMPASVTGVQLAQGIGVKPAVGFWTDAWQNVSRRGPARFALAWLGTVAFFAVFAPVLASGHPLWMTDTKTGVSSSPLWDNLKALDILLVVWGLVAVPFVLLLGSNNRGGRFWSMIGALMLGVAVVAVSGIIQDDLQRDAVDAARQARAVADAKGIQDGPRQTPFVRTENAGYIVGGSVGLVVLVLALLVPAGTRLGRLKIALPAVAIAVVLVGMRWSPPLERYLYIPNEVSGQVRAVYTVVPFSPFQRFSSEDRAAPLTTLGSSEVVPKGSAPAGRTFWAGTDAFGQDVLTQLLHSCRLAISIGLVATSISVIIGVTIGALCGYFGGWVDILLSRVIEIFMSVPVLFLLIVAASVVPPELRTAYVMMAIIGCFTWTGAARFTRAEFLKLRNQDFVQAAQATGTPITSVLFKHILPNGVAPVLVDTSFAIAAAISIEATLSYLGLGPVESASWGKLLASAISSEGEFKWWLAVFPGVAIFLTVLSYNLLGEALRDAIDPKLKKARV
jgi:peptide/nickel transport system permease protein